MFCQGRECLGPGGGMPSCAAKTTARVNRCTLKDFLLARPTRTSTRPHCAVNPRCQPGEHCLSEVGVQDGAQIDILVLQRGCDATPYSDLQSRSQPSMKGVCERNIHTVVWIDRGIKTRRR